MTKLSNIYSNQTLIIKLVSSEVIYLTPERYKNFFKFCEVEKIETDAFRAEKEVLNNVNVISIWME